MALNYHIGSPSQQFITVGAYITAVFLISIHCPGDVCGLQKADVTIYDGKPIWTIPGERYKNGMTHVVLLSDMALQTLKDVEQAKAKLDYQDITTYDPRNGALCQGRSNHPWRVPLKFPASFQEAI